MSTALSHYLENIRKASFKLDLSEERKIVHELETHIEDKLEELKKAGLSEKEAAETCVGLMGAAGLIARQIYEAHSQGTWKQALLASMPHLLFGLLFTLKWWQYFGWLSALLVLVLLTTIYGLWHGKPAWAFSWLGYSLLPVLATGILLVYLPRAWSLLAIPIYFLLALWWLAYIVSQSMKRDWLFTSLMLLPIPIIAGWYLAIAPEGRINEYSIQRTYDFAPWIGLSFLALGLALAAFIRIRQRWLRITLLVTSGILTLTMVAGFTNGRLGLPAFLVLILTMWGFFLIPAFLERRLKRWMKIQT